MTAVLVLADSIVVVVLLVAFYGTWRFQRWIGHHEIAPVSDSQLPKAAIILAVRGASSLLHNCLTSLARQNYPDFRVHVVIDHPTDPAHQVVTNWQREHPQFPLEIQFLQHPSPRTYLKTSAILQCLNSLPQEIGAAAMVDADAVVYPNWLRDLITPLIDNRIGLTSGNHWFDPNVPQVGSMVRCLGNALCVPPMYFMQATWGGSMALQRKVFDTDFFREAMLDTSSEEAAMQAAARKCGLALVLQPDIMILIQEPCSIGSTFRYFRRQLIWTRLYHPSWWLLLAGSSLAHLLLAVVLFVGLYGLVAARYQLALHLLGGLAVLILGSAALVEWMHRGIARRAERVQGSTYPPITMNTRLRMMATVPLAFTLFSYAMLAAAVARHVAWSGIVYEVLPPHGIRLMKYQTSQEVASRASSYLART